MIFSKKAAAIWMSWVLLMGFVVGLSVFMFGWAEDRGEVFVGQLEGLSDTAECDSVGIRVEEICQNTESLNMKIANRNTLTVDRLVFLVFDSLGQYSGSRVVDVSIAPDNVESVKILKQGTVVQLEIVPAIVTPRDQITCNRNRILLERIDSC